VADINWADVLVDQLDGHFVRQARPRLAGLSDAEYFWEPVAGWNVRRKSHSTAADAFGSGDFTMDYLYPEPVPAPFTTIAWRLNHILVGILGTRGARHFGGPAVGYESYDYPGTAAEALRRLDESYARWVAGVRSLSVEQLAAACGETEPMFPEASMAELVLHINREMIHHLAEIALLRDLYLHEH
jgi:hypothetical protein